jgi:hypothetical protein
MCRPVEGKASRCFDVIVCLSQVHVLKPCSLDVFVEPSEPLYSYLGLFGIIRYSGILLVLSKSCQARDFTSSDNSCHGIATVATSHTLELGCARMLEIVTEIT